MALGNVIVAERVHDDAFARRVYTPVGGIDMSKRSRARGQLKRKQVCQRIEAMILRGERAAGTKLRQRELATDLGVAEGLVREALLELKQSGLVESIERRGVF